MCMDIAGMSNEGMSKHTDCQNVTNKEKRKAMEDLLMKLKTALRIMGIRYGWACVGQRLEVVEKGLYWKPRSTTDGSA